MKLGDLKNFVEHLKQLPTLPLVGIKLIEAAEDRHSSLRDIARIIESDQALSAKLLKIANSAQFGFSRQVSTVERATSLLGLQLVRSLALSIIVMDVFRGEDGRIFNLIEYWRHCATSAIASKLIAERLHYPHPEEAFVAGLLHDIGKLVFLRWNRDEYEKAVEEAKATRNRLLEIEESHFGTGHTQVSRYLMEHWRFPASLVEAGWLHHQPLAHFTPNAKDQIAFIVKCANTLCHVQRFGDSGNPSVDMDLEQLARASGIPVNDLADISSEVLRQFEEVASYFDWDGCTPDLYLSAVSRANEELGRLHVELIQKNQKLISQQTALESICKLHELLPSPVNPSTALEIIVENLARAISCKRIMGFILLEREGIIEGRIRIDPSRPFQRVVLPLNGDVSERLSHPTVEFSLIELVMLKLGEGLEVSTEMMASLRKARLIALPLSASGVVMGQLIIEPPAQGEVSEQMIALLRQYARAVVIALERVFLFEAIERQAEDMARIARKGQETQTQLYQAERLASVGRLAAGAAHEINNPLAAISAQAQLLLRREKDEKDRKALQSIVDQSSRISKIISDLMGFARPAEPKIEPTAVRMIVDHMLSIIEHRIKNSGVEIRKEFQPDIPLIYADARQLEQVFLNLTINALQAMEKGGVLTIRVEVDLQKEQLKVEFIDTGVGIQPRDMPSIFDPFFTTKREGEGTGLGLAICHSIIENHNGDITVTSQPGKGSAFTVYLPLEGKSKIRQIQSDMKRKLHAVPRPEGKSGLILIIDDEEALRTVMAETLSQEGFQVELATDGVEGLEMLERKEYDVVLLDLRMPRKQGHEVLATIRKIQPQLSVIVVSGLAHENEFKAALDAGAFACLKKPFDVDELIATIRRAIQIRAGGRGSKSSNQIA